MNKNFVERKILRFERLLDSYTDDDGFNIGGSRSFLNHVPLVNDTLT